MLFNLEPDITVTGGAWYSDQDFESEFVEVLNQQCYKFLQQKVTVNVRYFWKVAIFIKPNKPLNIWAVWLCRMQGTHVHLTCFNSMPQSSKGWFHNRTEMLDDGRVLKMSGFSYLIKLFVLLTLSSSEAPLLLLNQPNETCIYVPYATAHWNSG